ncbi:hypothetical protein PV08_03185 [Exophiala spinifera]|uniref:ribonuclease Z n=1 Tax=Exophiala spinifera TaxID=91928 RepID=A0A0D1YUG3_9EURO|nr:uncharacterized protein PV08_03185 [Exophiala spinifera]KIW18896.1 hypothetical protein PV08_03185 [Exophiala spinifera]
MSDHNHGLKSVGVRTNFHAQFVTTPTSDTPGTSLLLHFDSKRYLIGELVEGTQRASIQRGLGLRKIRGLFLTGKTEWSNGGLIGTILTMADVQQGEVESDGSARRPRLNIYGGPKQLHSLACARRFVFRTGMPLSVHEFDASKHKMPRKIHEDENIRVWAIATEPRTDTQDDSETTALSDSDRILHEDKLDELRRDTEQGLRSQIVNNMFDSEWKKDRLVESKVGDINLPAMVWTRNPETKQLQPHTCLDRNNLGGLTLDTPVLVRMPWPASTVEKLPDASALPSNVSMSYIVKGHAQRGAFSPQKAKDLFLKPGKRFADLVAGKSVENDRGETITPDMVLEPGRPGRGIAIFDVPSVSHLLDLESKLDDQSDEVLEGVEAAVWICRGSLPYSPRFQALLSKLKTMKHIISHPDIGTDYITQTSSARSSLRLSKIASEFFTVPRYDNSSGYNPSRQTKSKTSRDKQTMIEVDDPEVEVVAATRGLKVNIEPKLVFDDSEVPPTEDLATLDMQLDQTIKDLFPEDMSPYRRSTTASSNDLEEPEIITLGTGSAAPSKYRNVSAVLLRMPHAMGNYLFDCGEGTLGQLKRLYNKEQLAEILYNLKAVWISHLHADHHLGTVTVLQAASSARKALTRPGTSRPAPPCLISEENMIDYMDEYQSVIGTRTESLCTPVVCHWSRSPAMSLRGAPFDFRQTNVPIRELKTVKVNHCHGAQAISVTFDNGFKFSYSGDCRPNESFCKIGADSDVLVHEATFDDGLEGDAQAKKHCTTGEAVGVALGMRAKNLILTHFSQRYQKIPVLSSVKMPEHVSEEDLLDDDDAEMTVAPELSAHQEATSVPEKSDTTAWLDGDVTRNLNIGVAFDLMRVKVSQIASMKRLFPAISRMFDVEQMKRDKERQEVSAALRAIEERKNAEKIARQEAHRKRFEESQAKKKVQKLQSQKGANQQKGNKRKLGQEKEQDSGSGEQSTSNRSVVPPEDIKASQAQAQAGENDTQSKLGLNENAKCAQKCDAGNHVATTHDSLDDIERSTTIPSPKTERKEKRIKLYPAPA